MNNILETTKLENYPIFKNLDKNEVQKFSSQIKLKKYNKNEIIIQEGDEGDSILFLIDGEINISQALTLYTNKDNKLDDREKEIIRLSSKNNNISLGEISIFSIEKKRSATVKAIKDCQIGILEFDDLFKICNNNHTIGFKIMQNISKIITEHLIKSNHKVLKLTTAFSLLIDN